MKNLFQIFLLIISISSLSFSKDIYKFDRIVKEYKKIYRTDSIVVAIYDNNTNKMVYVSDKDLAKNYKYIASSIMKPIIVSIALKNNVVKKEDLFFLHNDGLVDLDGHYPRSRYKVNQTIVKDAKEYTKQYFNYEEILLNSSNVGMSQLAQKIDTKDYIQGLKDFGFLSTQEIIDINEWVYDMDKYIYDGINEVKSAYSYGSLFVSTFDEILNAYIQFNSPNPTVINENIQSQIKNILIEKSKNQLLEINDKENVLVGIYTGSSQICIKREYLDKYIPSTFGFVNYKNKKYTIGVIIIDPFVQDEFQVYKYPSYSSTVLFTEIVNKLTKK